MDWKKAKEGLRLDLLRPNLKNLRLSYGADHIAVGCGCFYIVVL